MKRGQKFNDTLISIIILTQNDQKIVSSKLKEIEKSISLLETNYEIIIVDNNSSDKTVNKIKNDQQKFRNLRVIILSKAYEPEVALTAGLDNCVGDYVILFNIYTDPPSIILSIISELFDQYDVVIGKVTRDLIKRTLPSLILTNFANRFSRSGYRHSYNYLTGLSRKAVNSITRTRRKSRSLAYIPTLIGFKTIDIEYQPLKKHTNKLKQENFMNLLALILDTTISNSFRPVRIISLLGLIASFLFLLYVLGVVILVVFFNMKGIAPQGWISVSTVMGSLFFLLFSLLGLVAEYVIRSITESRDEPIYFIADETDQSTYLQNEDKLNVV